MRIIYALLATSLLLVSCRINPKVRESGVMVSENRPARAFQKIKLLGFMDLVITQDNDYNIKVEGDENFLRYLTTRIEDRKLVIKMRSNMSYHSSSRLTVYVSAPQVDEIIATGSGNVSATNKIKGDDKLVLKVLGMGNMSLDINTPELDTEISGSGTINLKGETRDANIQINGVGTFNSEDLKAENAKIKISGSGDVRIFADQLLDVRITGIGSVYYRGNAAVKEKITGSGSVKRIDN